MIWDTRWAIWYQVRVNLKVDLTDQRRNFHKISHLKFVWRQLNREQTLKRSIFVFWKIWYEVRLNTEQLFRLLTNDSTLPTLHMGSWQEKGRFKPSSTPTSPSRRRTRAVLWLKIFGYFDAKRAFFDFQLIRGVRFFSSSALQMRVVRQRHLGFSKFHEKWGSCWKQLVQVLFLKKIVCGWNFMEDPNFRSDCGHRFLWFSTVTTTIVTTGRSWSPG